MPPVIWVAIAALVVAVFFLRRLLAPSLDGVIRQAIRDRDVAALVVAVGGQRAARQPTLYNHAIRRLWDTYERDLATLVIKELTRQHHTSSIAQYWLKQVAQTEPELANRILTKQFFDSHYLPEVAARCGPVG